MDKSQPLKLHVTSQYWFTLKWLGSLSPSEAMSVTALEKVGAASHSSISSYRKIFSRVW